jgi:hypothetical protein
MSVKKATEPPRLIRYLLCADRRLQRISLRRMSVPTKKTKKAPRSIRLKNSARARHSRGFPWAINPRAIIVGVICVMGTAALMATRQPSRRVDVTIGGAQPEAHTTPESDTPLESHTRPEPQQMAAAPRLDTKKAIVPEAPATMPAADTYAVHASMTNVPAVESIEAVPVATAAEPVVNSTPKAAAAESITKAAVESVASVTITGCLELDEETFWLKDTSGVDAPASRSWRSGFLKKRPSRIELLDATNALKLLSYVGQRVAATGTLENREMQMRSLRRLAASCR